MPPLTLAAVISLVEAAITEVPALVTEFQALFASGTPSADQFQALLTKIQNEEFNP